MKTVTKFLAGILLLAGVACGTTGYESSSTSYDGGTAADSTYEVAASDIVDVMGESQQAQFCTAYEALGYDLGFSAFASGYKEADPSAADVFAELVSRC